MRNNNLLEMEGILDAIDDKIPPEIIPESDKPQINAARDIMERFKMQRCMVSLRF